LAIRALHQGHGRHFRIAIPPYRPRASRILTLSAELVPQGKILQPQFDRRHKQGGQHVQQCEQLLTDRPQEQITLDQPQSLQSFRNILEGQMPAGDALSPSPLNTSFLTAPSEDPFLVLFGPDKIPSPLTIILLKSMALTRVAAALRASHNCPGVACRPGMANVAKRVASCSPSDFLFFMFY
jgi:hypothetical protein